MDDNDLIRRGDALAAVQLGDTVTKMQARIRAIPSVDADPVCTDCGGTGITYQTERRCACQPAITPASDGRAEALREAAVWREAATIARDHGFTNAQWRAGGENARGALFHLFMARAAELEKADE